jgi:hypothetical protein
MFSTMGNAFTFPLQTAIFTSIVRSVYRCLHIPIIPGEDGNFGVNGDDIIVTKAADPYVRLMLKAFGFTVNDKKSHSVGFFRESCGGDYYHGHGIRGVYCKTLRSKQDKLSCINRLVRWSASQNVSLDNALAFLARSIRGYVPFIPPYEDDASGLKVPVAHAHIYDWYTQYGLPDSHSYEMFEFSPKGVPLAVLEEKFGPDAVLIAAVRGELAGGRLVTRSNDGFYRLCRRVTPNWEYTDGGITFDVECCSRWTRTADAVVKLLST